LDPVEACGYADSVRLLLVEDSPRLQTSIPRGLRGRGFIVDVVGNGREALSRALAIDYDVIILDLLLPGLDGWSVLQQLREAGSRTCVLVLSALDQVEDRVRGLRTGADDYLPKPFSFDELVARIEALIRRRHDSKRPQLEIGNLVIDTAKKSVVRSGKTIELSAREYRLLEFLAFRLGHVVSREEIEDRISGRGKPVQSNAVDSAICSLRAKLEIAGERRVIRTHRGLGYSLDPRSSPSQAPP
jgi:two-component system copper resistance phosphate regulon response regulator CusR